MTVVDLRVAAEQIRRSTEGDRGNIDNLEIIEGGDSSETWPWI